MRFARGHSARLENGSISGIYLNDLYDMYEDSGFPAPCYMLRNPAVFAPDEGGGFVVTFRDIPEAITQGDTLEEARAEAADALLTAMDLL